MNMKPIKPDESACCGTGCNPCIFDVYAKQLKKWEENELLDQTSVALDELNYLPFLIDSIEIISSSIKTFKFQSVKLLGETVDKYLISNAQCGVDYDIQLVNLGLKAGHYIILRGQYEDTSDTGQATIHNISRSYTPILSEPNNGSFRIIVSIICNGKMSQFLNKLKEKDIVFWRGPYKDFCYKTNAFQRLLLIGGGTGVVPLYNISKEVVENDIEETQITYLACFHNIESMILRNEFAALQDYWNFKMKIFISNQQDNNSLLKYNEHVTFSKLTEELIFKELSNTDINKCYIVICGPDSFNNFIYSAVLNYGCKKGDIYVFR